jgi:hypothetical protein
MDIQARSLPVFGKAISEKEISANRFGVWRRGMNYRQTFCTPQTPAENGIARLFVNMSWILRE